MGATLENICRHCGEKLAVVDNACEDCCILCDTCMIRPADPSSPMKECPDCNSLRLAI